MGGVSQGGDGDWESGVAVEADGGAVDVDAGAGAAAVEDNVVLGGGSVGPVGVEEEEEEVS